MKRLLHGLNRLELLWLALLAPLFYFPGDGRGLVILAIPVLWLVRKAGTGRFLPVTTVNAPLLVLLAMMGVGLAVSVDPDVSFPYVTRALLGIAVFFALADIEGRRGVQLSLLALVGAVMAMVLLGLFDTSWPEKIPQLTPLIDRIPSYSLPLAGGADTFNPNIVGGLSLFVLPLLVLLAWPWQNPLSALLPARVWRLAYLATLLLMGLALLTLVVSQARGAYLSFAVGVLALVLLPSRRLMALATVIAVVAIVALYRTGNVEVMSLIRGADASAISTGVESLGARVEIWSRALYALQDFPFTGVGIGMFSRVVGLLYPLTWSDTENVIGHPHNQFLAAGVDYGIPGLIAYLALWLLMAALLWRVWHSALPVPYRRLALGLAATAVAHFTWSVADALVIGARGHLPFWLLLAAVVTLHELASKVGVDLPQPSTAESGEDRGRDQDISSPV